MASERPERQLQKLVLLVLGSKTYLLVIDYFSRYVEIAQLSHTRSTDFIVHLRSIFARHGILEVLMSVNGPHFFGQAFTYCGFVWVQTHLQ